MNPTEAELTSEATPLKTEAGEAYPPKSEASEPFQAKSEATEPFPLSNERRKSTYPQQVHATSKAFGATSTIISLLVASIIPIIQVTIGWIYKGDCPIDQRIATYMIVAGGVGLAFVVLSLLLSIIYRCLLSDSPELEMLACCCVCCNCATSFLLILFCLAWWIVGCVWVFSVASHVQFTLPMKPNYCEPVLYRAAFILLIITPIWFCIQGCVVSCIQYCFKGAVA